MPAPSPAHIRETVARVLDDPLYAWWRTPSESGGWTQAVVRALRGFFARIAILQAEQPVLYWTLLVGLLVLAVGLLVHAGWTVRVALRASAGTTPGDGRAEHVDYRELAARFAARGDHLEAARHVQLAVLELLVARRVIPLARSDSNAVLRRRLRAARLAEQEQHECLGLIGRLERACFRDDAGSEELYRAWCGLHERLAQDTA